MATTNDYLPKPDGEFDDWQANFITVLAANAATWNIPANEVTDLQTPYQNNWNTAWSIVKTGNATSAQRAGKKAARTAYEPRLRQMVQTRIRRNPLISAEQLALLGVPAIDSVRTEVPPPATIPQVDVKPMSGNKVKIYFKQEVGEDGITRRGKPKGVATVEFAHNTGGTPPANPSQCAHRSLESRSPVVVNFEPEEAGQRVYFFARWLNAKGQAGDWTERHEFIVP